MAVSMKELCFVFCSHVGKFNQSIMGFSVFVFNVKLWQAKLKGYRLIMMPKSTAIGSGTHAT